MDGAVRGRGTRTNPPGRFERTTRALLDDDEFAGEAAASLATEVRPEAARSLITRNQSPDIGFEQSINPYRGCEHGCVYCYARPSHAYVGLSPGLDFETRLFFKARAGALLREELARPGYRCRPIALGANTDPYQPIERGQRVTREVLEVLAECAHPVTIVTKGVLVLRDLDLLAPMADLGLATVTLSITTLSADTKRTLEPRAASPAARLRAVRELADAGVPVGVFVAPVIPAVTDHELEDIVAAAAEAGARYANYVMLRLPFEVKDLFRDWLAQHLPLRAEHVMSVLAAMRDGRDNDPRFGYRMRGTGPFADLVRRRFLLACRRAGIGRDGPALDTTRFRAPSVPTPQLALDL